MYINHVSSGSQPFLQALHSSRAHYTLGLRCLQMKLRPKLFKGLSVSKKNLKYFIVSIKSLSWLIANLTCLTIYP